MTGYSMLEMLLHFATLSLLSVGGAMGTAPEMHRFLVAQRGWLTDGQFTDSIALAQAAPGPNILFVTLIGWQCAGFLGALAATVGILTPSSALCFAANRWRSRNEDRALVKAIRLGLSPIAIGMTLSAGWIIMQANGTQWQLGVLTAAAFALFLFSRVNPLWLIIIGAVAGALGLA